VLITKLTPRRKIVFYKFNVLEVGVILNQPRTGAINRSTLYRHHIQLDTDEAVTLQAWICY
jgi:hypothetical protein